MIKTVLHPTDSVMAIARRLETAGFQAWCVGGAVRDALLGGVPLDWDLATTAHPSEVLELFGPRRTIPVGIEFGTVGVLDPAGVVHELTTFRRDVQTDGRHAIVEFGVSLNDDLARRDFTVNAIAFRPVTGELRDPFGGQIDLAARVIRAVGDPDARMREDRLRALRAIRFASRYGFTIDAATYAAVVGSAPFLTRLSAERVQQELVKTMEQVARPSNAFRLWKETGALSVLLPALSQLDDIALSTLDGLPIASAGGLRRPHRTSNRVAALFLGVSPAILRQSMLALRFSKHEVAWTVRLGERWVAVGGDIATKLLAGRPSDREVRGWLATLGRFEAGAFLRIAHARWFAMNERGHRAPSVEMVRALHRRMERSRFADALELSDVAVGGDDLVGAGIPPGPLYAKILHALLELVLDDPSRNTPEALLAEVPRIVAALRSGDEHTVHPSTEP